MARKFIIKSDAPRASLISYREALNEEQRAVVGAGAGPILVIAGAGSGKTRTVTYRVALHHRSPAIVVRDLERGRRRAVIRAR